MIHSTDLDRSDRTAFQRGEQHTSETVPNGRTESTLERLNVEPSVLVRRNNAVLFNTSRQL